MSLLSHQGLARCPCGEESTCQCRIHKRLVLDPWAGKIPWGRARQPTHIFLPGESHGQRSLARYIPWGRKEADTTERLTLSLVVQWLRICLVAQGTWVCFLVGQSHMPARHNYGSLSTTTGESLHRNKRSYVLQLRPDSAK